jgi:hypothetical protein
MMDDDEVKEQGDPLATGRGIVFGLIAGTMLWVLLIGGVFLYLR